MSEYVKMLFETLDRHFKMDCFNRLLDLFAYDFRGKQFNIPDGIRFRGELERLLEEKGFPINCTLLSENFLSMEIDSNRTLLHHVLEGPYLKGYQNAVNEKALNKDYCDIIHLMLDKGADVNALDSYGWNALMYASFYGAGLPEDLYLRILNDTKNLNQAGNYKRYGFCVYKKNQSINRLKEYVCESVTSEQTASQILIDACIMANIKGAESVKPERFRYKNLLEVKDELWQKVSILLDAGVDFKVDENCIVQPQDRELLSDIQDSCRRVREKIEMLKDIKTQLNPTVEAACFDYEL